MKLKIFIIIFMIIGLIYISPINKNNIEKYNNYWRNRYYSTINRLRNEQRRTSRLNRDKRNLYNRLGRERRACNAEKRRLRGIIRAREIECRNILKHRNRNVSHGLGTLKNKMSSHASKSRVFITKDNGFLYQ